MEITATQHQSEQYGNRLSQGHSRLQLQLNYRTPFGSRWERKSKHRSKNENGYVVGKPQNCSLGGKQSMMEAQIFYIRQL